MSYQHTLAPRIAEILKELHEHFDAIQILATYLDDDGNTGQVSAGIGNHFARQGICREFLEQDAAATNAFELSKVLYEEEDDEDD